jgi:AbrB family looped-hinge helix DNA binding protein
LTNKKIFSIIKKVRNSENLMQQVASTFEEFVKVQSKGLITIPKQLRREFKIDEKTIVKIKREGKKITIEPIKTISYPVRSYTKEEVKEFLAYDAAQTKELKKKGLL